MNWPSITFEYGPFPRPRLDYDLFGFHLGWYGRISADGRAFTLPPEYIHIDQVGYRFLCFMAVDKLIYCVCGVCIILARKMPQNTFL